jgi:hypothetical protein
MTKRKKFIKYDPFGREIESGEETDDTLLRDGERIRVPLFFRDGAINPALSDVQRAIAARDQQQLLVTDGTNDPVNLHKPGYRYLTDTTARSAGDVALKQAYEAYDQEQSRRWQHGDATREFVGEQEGAVCMVSNPEYPLDQGSAGHLRTINGRLICVPDKPRNDAQTIDAREDAYAAYDAAARNAWRG